MFLRFLILPIIFIFFISGTYAQNKKLQKKINECIKVGDIYTAAGHYDIALAYYQQAHIYDIDNTNSILKIAESYRSLRKYPQSEEWYLSLALTTDRPYPLSLFWIGRMLQNQGRYVEAKRAFQDFEMSYPFTDEYRTRTDEELLNCNRAMLLKADPVKVTIRPLNKDKKLQGFTSISLIDSFGYSIDNYIDEASAGHKRVKTKKIDPIPMDSIRYRNLVKVNVEDFVDEELGYDDINLDFPGEILGLPSRYKDIVVAVFRSKGTEHLFFSSYRDGTWDKWEKIVGLDDKKVAYMDPHLVKEWNELHLYYSSKSETNKGGYDIEACVFESGSKIKSVDLPIGINTMFDERFPHYDGDRNTLYFSSTGLTGLGGFDIFKIEGRPGAEWGKVANMGYPVNTSFDDFSYCAIDEMRGVFSSNRTKKLYDTSFDNLFIADFTPKPIFVRINLEDKFSDLIEDNSWDVSYFQIELADKDFIAIKHLSDSSSPVYDLNIDENYLVSIGVGGEQEPFKFQLVPINKSITSMQDSLTYYFYIEENEFLSEIPEGLLVRMKEEEVKYKEEHKKRIQEKKEEASITLVDAEPNKENDNNSIGDSKSKKTAVKEVKTKPNKEEVSRLAKEHNINFKVQLGVFSKDRNDYFKREVRLVAVSEERIGKLYKYYFGGWVDLDEAIKACKEVRESVIPDAFVVAFKDGKRITIAEAKAFLNMN